MRSPGANREYEDKVLKDQKRLRDLEKENEILNKLCIASKKTKVDLPIHHNHRFMDRGRTYKKGLSDHYELENWWSAY